MNEGFQYVFPAIRGVQATRDYYVSMCPLRLIPRMFLFDEEELTPEVRAQRSLNKARIPELSRYVMDNPDSYVFSALTASVDAEIDFEPLVHEGAGGRIGLLKIPMSGRFIINDGQHRRAAIEAALKERPELGEETIAVVFFIDAGLQRCQQMFADLNRHAVRPSTSIGTLYDHRDDKAELARRLVFESDVFRDLVEMERSNLARRSRRLFTFSAMYTACNALLQGFEKEPIEKRLKIAQEFWEVVSNHLPEWKLVRRSEIPASEVRQDLIHTHGVALQALGRVGNDLLRNHSKDWKKRLAGIEKINWSRKNPEWQGRAIVSGRVSKSLQSIQLTANLIKTKLRLPLTKDEKQAEAEISGGKSG